LKFIKDLLKDYGKTS